MRRKGFSFQLFARPCFGVRNFRQRSSTGETRMAVSLGQAAKPCLLEGFKRSSHVFFVAGVRLPDISTCLQKCHSTFYRPHSVLHTVNYILHTPLSTLHTLHSSLLAPHFALFTPRSTLDTLNSSIQTPHSSLHTLHFTAVCILHFTLLLTQDFTLHN